MKEQDKVNLCVLNAYVNNINRRIAVCPSDEGKMLRVQFETILTTSILLGYNVEKIIDESEEQGFYIKIK